MQFSSFSLGLTIFSRVFGPLFVQQCSHLLINLIHFSFLFPLLEIINYIQTELLNLWYLCVKILTDD